MFKRNLDAIFGAGFQKKDATIALFIIFGSHDLICTQQQLTHNNLMALHPASFLRLL